VPIRIGPSSSRHGGFCKLRVGRLLVVATRERRPLV
jgi:hypothetical protein